MSLNQRMQEAYDQIASEYTAQYGTPTPVVIDWGGRFLRLVEPGGRVLDVGCGPGQYMALIESLGTDVVGIDLSAGMLEQARAKVHGDLIQMDMRHLAFSDGAFQGIWCVASLLHIPKADASAVLEEIWRVLAPGGVLFLNTQEGAEEGWEENRFFGTTQRFYARYTQEEVERLLVSTGFMVQDKGLDQSPLRRWLQFLAVKPA